MSFQLHVLAYPWDLLEADGGQVLARLRGEVGVDGLSVWAAIPPVLQLRARDPSPRVFSNRGGVFFQPRESLYSRLHCAPVVSSWVRSKDPLDDIRKLCDRHGLGMRVVLSASRTGRMAERYPELSCRNAFGTESRESLCPANADVQAYLLALIANVQAAYAPSAVVLADLRIAWGEAARNDLRTPATLTPATRSALGVCFCDSCRRIAAQNGTDPDRARASAIAGLTAAWTVGARGPTVEPETLRAYTRQQSTTLASLLQKLKAGCACPLLLDLNTAPGASAAEVDRLAADAVVYSIDESASLAKPAEPIAARWEIRLDAGWTVGERGPTVVTLLSEAAELGAAGACVDNLGLLSDAGFTVLKQAARFGRRTAPAQAL